MCSAGISIKVRCFYGSNLASATAPGELYNMEELGKAHPLTLGSKGV